MKSDYEIFDSLISNAMIYFKREKIYFDENDYRVMSQVLIERFLTIENKLISGCDNIEIEKKKQAIFQLIESKIYG
jgi:hypothetical protein